MQIYQKTANFRVDNNKFMDFIDDNQTEINEINILSMWNGFSI